MKKYFPTILRFFLIAILLQVGRELEIDRQVGALITTLLTLLAFVWAFRGNEIFSYRLGQNLFESVSKEKKVSSDNKSKKEKTSNNSVLFIIIIGLVLVIIGLMNDKGESENTTDLTEVDEIENSFSEESLKDQYAKNIDIGLQFRKKGDHYSAIVEFGKAIEIDPLSTRGYFERGNAKYFLKDYENAILDFDKVIELNPTEFSDAYFFRGLIKEILYKNYNGAISDYTKAIKLDQNILDYYLYRGEAKHQIDDFYGAISDISKYIDLYDDSVDNKYRLIKAYEERIDIKFELKDYIGVIEDCSKLIEFRVSSGIDVYLFEPYFDRADAKRIINDNYGAISDYTEVIKLSPNNAQAYTSRGVCKLSIGDKTNGCIDIRKGFSLGDNNAKLLDMCF